MKKEIKKSVSTAVVLSGIKKQASPILTKLRKITKIKSKEDYELAAQQLKLLKAVKKIAEDKQDAIINPMNTSMKGVKELFNPFIEQCENTEKEYKTMMLAFDDTLDEKKNKLLTNFSGKGGNISKYTDKVMELSVSTADAKKKMIWTVEVVNEKEIPREFLVPDMAKIKESFKAGKPVKGCKYEQKKVLAI